MTLQEAALKVGVSKKALDDYLLQIRFGARFGFDFKKHGGAKVGVLRAFVAKNKRRCKKECRQKKVNYNAIPLKCCGLSNEFVTMLTDLRTSKGKRIKSARTH